MRCSRSDPSRNKDIKHFCENKGKWRENNEQRISGKLHWKKIIQYFPHTQQPISRFRAKTTTVLSVPAAALSLAEITMRHSCVIGWSKKSASLFLFPRDISNSGESAPAKSSNWANQGCQMVCFQTKNPNLGKFWRVLQWKKLVYLMDTWSILRSFVIFY
jgi:hypothetical protein